MLGMEHLHQALVDQHDNQRWRENLVQQVLGEIEKHDRGATGTNVFAAPVAFYNHLMPLVK